MSCASELAKPCYVYVDDVIIFSENEKDHVKHLDWVLKSLCDANMKVSREKTQFFKQSVEYLWFVVTKGGAKIDPEKVNSVQEYPEPKCLYELRSLLGLASY